MLKVSVIVPVYNSRDYLVPCLESLVNQTLDEIEIVLVDDHGEDDSMEVARKYLETYSGGKSVVYAATSANSGPGVARNVGIAAATGEYVAFVDSDDWVEVNFCELLYKAARKRDADLAYCHLSRDNRRDGASKVLENPVVSNGEFTQKKHKYFLSRYVSYFTTFLYRRQFLADKAIRFPETRSSEDSSFLGCCLLSAVRIAVVEKPMYHYVVRRNSLSTAKDGGKYLQKLSSFDDMLSYAKRNDLYEPYAEELEYIYVKKAFLMSVVTYVTNSGAPETKVLQELHEGLLQRIPLYKSNRYLRRDLKAKTLAGMIRRNPWLAKKVIVWKYSAKEEF